MSTTLTSPEKTPVGSVVRSSWKVRELHDFQEKQQQDKRDHNGTVRTQSDQVKENSAVSRRQPRARSTTPLLAVIIVL